MSIWKNIRKKKNWGCLFPRNCSDVWWCIKYNGTKYFSWPQMRLPKKENRVNGAGNKGPFLHYKIEIHHLITCLEKEFSICSSYLMLVSRYVVKSVFWKPK